MPDTSQFQINAMAPLRTWGRLIWENGGVAYPYWGKLARILLPTTLAFPLRLVERWCYGRRVAQTTIDKPPLIILGFARSGTTHLHNLLYQDPQYGTISTFQAVMPTFFLMGRGWLKPLLAKSMPSSRPMDAVAVSLDMPQEEELAIANTCHLSTVHQLSFPQETRTYFEKYTMMQGLTDKELSRWEQTYMEILRKATLDNNGRQMVLKSPTNMGRISHLLRIFPEAKFVHIIRNPYRVYQSIMHMFRTLLPIHQLQPFDESDIEEYVLHSYRVTMQQYLKDRALIPEENFAEVRFEDLDRCPLEEMERIYAQLALPDWERAQRHINNYIQTLSNYRKNRFSMVQSMSDRISREWQFALDGWGYQLPTKSTCKRKDPH